MGGLELRGMVQVKFGLVWIMLAASACGLRAQTVSVPKTIFVDGAELARIKQNGDAGVIRAARQRADKAMKAVPGSVMDKKSTPPSGDKHDYMSLARYYWPNPNTPDHLPYIRKDGETNPQIKDISDEQNLDHMADQVRDLGLAYYLTGNEAYAGKAAEVLRVWFLNPATKMNPNLQYAQAVLGVNEGRGTGILDARHLIDVVDGLALLRGSKSWGSADEAGIHAWFEAYFTWLTTSDHGKAETAAKNNHGAWKDVQDGAIALYLGKVEFVKTLVETAKMKRVGVEILADGEEPLEEARTKSFSYSVFDLDALMKIAVLGEKVGVDLWDYTAPGGGSIRKSLDYLLLFVGDPGSWKKDNITGMHTDDMKEPLLMGALAYRSAEYESAALKLGGKDELAYLVMEQEFTDMKGVK